MNDIDKTESELFDSLNECREKQAIARNKLYELRAKLASIEFDLIENKIKEENLKGKLERLQSNKM